MIDQKLLEILACPACEDRPHLELKGESLVCNKCKRIYPIKNGIPVMLVEEAEIRE